MSAEENKAIVRRAFEEIWNQDKLDAVDEIIASDFVFHDMREDYQGPKALKQYVSGVRAAFPDSHWDIGFQLAEGDRVVTYFTWHGTHQGEIMIGDIPAAPTGRRVKLEGVSIDQVAGGKISETWIFRYRLGPALGFKSVPSQEQT
jgi:predicted ester cyclase